MEKKKRPRAADPLWILVCRLWDEISEPERRQIVQAMQLFAARRRKSEGPDNADTPVESMA